MNVRNTNIYLVLIVNAHAIFFLFVTRFVLDRLSINVLIYSQLCCVCVRIAPLEQRNKTRQCLDRHNAVRTYLWCFTLLNQCTIFLYVFNFIRAWPCFVSKRLLLYESQKVYPVIKQNYSYFSGSLLKRTNNKTIISP